MRILILTNYDGGLYLFRRELLEELLAHGDEVHVSLPLGAFSGKLEAMGCKLIDTPLERRGMNPLADIALYRMYKRIIQEVRPDVVFTYTVKPNVYGGLACQRNKVPYLSNVTGLGTAIENGGILQRITLFLYRQGLKGARHVFFQNQSNLDFMVTKGIVERGREHLLPGSGVNVEHFAYREYPPVSDKVNFLFIGRIMKDKGVDELLEVFQKLHDSKAPVSLTVLGNYDGPYKETIEKAHHSGVINYIGAVEDVRPYVESSHCIVLPSYHEGMSNVLLESSSMGRPVITTRVPGCLETFAEGVTGFGCEAKSSESLLEAVERFLSLSAEKREAMGRAAREKMVSEFDRRQIIAAYMNALQTLESERIK